jgi:hypothetical protein
VNFLENFADILFQRRFDIQSNIILNIEYDYGDLPESLKQNKRNEFGRNWAAVSESLIAYGEVLIETSHSYVTAVNFDFSSFVQYGAYGLRALECLIMKALEKELPVIIDTRIADYRGVNNTIVGNAFIGYVNGWDGWQPSNIHGHAMSIMTYKGKQMIDQYLEICLRMQRGLLLLIDNKYQPEWDWLENKSSTLLGNKVDRSGLMIYLENEAIPLIEKIYKTTLSAVIRIPDDFDNMQMKNFWEKLNHKTKIQSFVLIDKERLDYLKINNQITNTNIDSAIEKLGFVKETLNVYREMFFK